MKESWFYWIGSTLALCLLLAAQLSNVQNISTKRSRRCSLVQVLVKVSITQLDMKESWFYWKGPTLALLLLAGLEDDLSLAGAFAHATVRALNSSSEKF